MNSPVQPVASQGVISTQLERVHNDRPATPEPPRAEPPAPPPPPPSDSGRGGSVDRSA